MPGGTARLRVSGAIAKRLGSVIGPSLNGSNSLEGVLISGLSQLDDAGELGITAAGASREAIPPAQASCARSPPFGRHQGIVGFRAVPGKTIFLYFTPRTSR